MTHRIGKGTTIGSALHFVASLLLWAAVAEAAPAWTPPPVPAVAPQLPASAELDVDRNRVDDRIDTRLGAIRQALAQQGAQGRSQAAAELAAPVPVELVFSSRITQQQIDDFLALGGTIHHVYQSVSYGWSGTLPGASVDALPAAMGSSLVVIAEDAPAQLHLDEATRTGRIRPVWARGFAGVSGGVSGTSDITIGIVDSGVDGSHTDLTGRAEYWKDFTSDAEANPHDVVQHGSHVAGIALGSGAAFGVGPGTLKWTDSGDMSGIAANNFLISMMHIPAGFRTLTQNSTYLGTGPTTLYLGARSNGLSVGFLTFNSAAGNSPIALSTYFNGNNYQGFSSALVQNAGKTIGRYATSNSLTDYPAVGDGFNAMRGVAPGARWAGAKVFTNSGAGSSATIGAAVDDLVTQRVAHNIKVVNMSLGIIGSPGLDPTLRAKVNTMVNNGIVVVCSAGNDGAGTGVSNVVDDPGRAGLALTVGASNDANAVTKYTSSGFASPGTDEDSKPDLLAPGGSDYYSAILSVDSNDADTGNAGFADKVANDYYNIKGTSMASPFAAGAAALVIDAMQKQGTDWKFQDSAQPLLVKMLLCAGSTESNANREINAGTNPVLGRAAAPKDLFEGYGLMNPDAAVEAVSLAYNGGQLGDSSDGGTFDRRAWGRRLGITSGGAVTLTLTVPATGDYDLYLYSGTPNAKGNPVIVTSSTNAGLGLGESITFTPTTSETRYLFIKRVSGSGAWSLDSATASIRCGDGVKAGSEQCDDGNLVGGDCCSAECTNETNGSPCDDGLFCTTTDTCSAGVCSGTGNPCATGPECNNTCNETNDNCFSTSGTSCSTDSNPCTLDQCNGSGSCGHVAGNAGAVCRASAGVCDSQETCTGTTTSCPPDGFASLQTVCRAASGACDAAENCSGFSANCPADSFLGTSTVCRAASGVCDVQEVCSGSSAACPANTFLGTTSVCRASAGVCDPQEVCSGSSSSCPANVLSGTATVCRASAGVCDVQETCNGSAASCPADALAPSTNVCRASAGVCDAAESCTGSTTSCPSDVLAPTTTVCRIAAGVCDVAETCNGSSSACPANALATTAVVCRAAATTCDQAETCNGSTTACPTDAFAPSTTVCRAAAGVCDNQETCTGTSGTCPADALKTTASVCRASAGVCDPAEVCSGSGVNCPVDALAATTTVCRASAGVCDSAETCDGVNDDCPADVLAGAATVCRAAAGVCDAAEKCTGNTAACPADVFLATTTVCRESAGVCDAAENCSGASASCPGDAFLGTSTVCRASGGVCDLQERCSGAGASCPADAVAPTTTSCRASAGECDAAETCDGAGKACPVDAFAPANTGCSSDGLTCTLDVCSGSSAACTHPAGNAGTVCRASAGICDSAESCNGTSTSCPADAFAGTSTVCRSASGVCDVQETCNGASASCPADAVAGTTVVCRASGGECDLAETCGGVAKSCPANAFVAADTGCSSDSNSCTNDVCNGSSAACTHPSNTLACNDGVFCNGSDTCGGGTCSVHAGNPCPGADGDGNCAESCNEAADACTAPDLNGSTCDDGLACTTGDTCQAGACAADHSGCGQCGDGSVDDGESCDDGNTADGDCCSSNCKPATNGQLCDDGVYCNGEDSCQSGLCDQHDGDPCRGPDGDANCAESCDEDSDACSAADPDTSECNDGVFCNGADTCAGGACSQHAGNPCVGADGDGNCAESCNENNDNCKAADPNSSPCNDGLFCNGADTCQAGACDQHAGNPCPGADGDGNCAESCNEAGDVCNAADTGGSACNDGVFCNGSDSCNAGACSVHAGDPCVGPDGDGNCAESCNEAGDACNGADPNGSACSDNSFCNGADTCQAGACSQHAGSPCPGADGDGNCAESCDEGADNCLAGDPNGSTCNDGLPCTSDDACQGGVCSGDAVVTGDCGTTTTTTLPETECGDANEDGSITASDALKALRTAVESSSCPVSICDYNNDGRVTASDALAILRKAVGQNVAAGCGVLTARDPASSTTTTLEAVEH